MLGEALASGEAEGTFLFYFIELVVLLKVGVRYVLRNCVLLQSATQLD